jgi:hypothetical protein
VNEIRKTTQDIKEESNKDVEILKRKSNWNYENENLNKKV